jgi:hypothetical protein
MVILERRPSDAVVVTIELPGWQSLSYAVIGMGEPRSKLDRIDHVVCLR